jgi:uncharacterized protein YndB with AHSA1/START domain
MAQREAEAAEAVVREVHIEAAPELVYSYFIDPAKMSRWKGRSAELDPTPGGDYLVRISDVALARGNYVELVPNERVVFTWGWEGSEEVPPGSSTVEVTLTPTTNGTMLRLVHRDLPTAEDRKNHALGWDHYLPRLVTSAQGGDPGPDQHA